MRYIVRKGYVKHGNCSWRRTIYTDTIGSGSIRDMILGMRLKDAVPKRRLFNMWVKDKVPTEKVYPSTVAERRREKWRV